MGKSTKQNGSPKAEDDPVAAGLAREREREAVRRADAVEADRERRLGSILSAMAEPDRLANDVWSDEQRAAYRGTQLVGPKELRVFKPKVLHEFIAEHQRTYDDKEWEDLRERCTWLPSSRLGTKPVAWAAKTAPALVLDGLWIPLTDAIRQSGHAEAWIAHLRAKSIAVHLRSTLGTTKGVDVDTVVEVGAQMLSSLLSDAWTEDGPSRARRVECFDLLSRTRAELPLTFEVLGRYGWLLRRAVEDARKPAPGSGSNLEADPVTPSHSNPAGGPVPQARGRATHAPDFSWLRTADGRTFQFAGTQRRRVVEYLFNIREQSGRIDGHGATNAKIAEEVEANQSNFRVDKTFSRHPALNTIIRKAGRGQWALYLDPPGEQGAPESPNNPRK